MPFTLEKISNHKLFTFLNRSECFIFQLSRECVFGRHTGTIHLGFDGGKLPTWPPGEHTDGEAPERLQIRTLWSTSSLKLLCKQIFQLRVMCDTYWFLYYCFTQTKDFRNQIPQHILSIPFQAEGYTFWWSIAEGYLLSCLCFIYISGNGTKKATD